MVLLAAWCGLRFGELAGLTRTDLDAGTVSVRRAVVRLPGEFVAGGPETAAGKRTVAIPPHLLDELRWHLDHHVLAPGGSPVFTATTPATAATSRSTPSTTPSGRPVRQPGARTCTCTCTAFATPEPPSPPPRAPPSPT